VIAPILFPAARRRREQTGGTGVTSCRPPRHP
jgi:hypothetical protein